MIKSITLVAFAALLGSPLARAEFVGGTYNPAAPDNVFAGGATLGANNTQNTFVGLAQQFTLSQDIFSLSQLTLPLENASGASPALFDFEIRSTSPDIGAGTPLYTGVFSSSGIGSTFGAVTAAIHPTGAEGLAAGSYWLVLNADSSQTGPGLIWGSVTGPSATADPSMHTVNSSDWLLSPETTYGMALGELTPAPEPGQIAMGAILCSCIAGYTIRQRKVNAKKA